MGKWMALKPLSLSENESMKTGCIFVRSFRKTASRLLMLCSLVWPYPRKYLCPTCSRALSKAKTGRHSQDSAVRVLWVLVCNIFTISKCQKLSYKTSGIFSVNLQISHLTCWIRIVNFFKSLEILSCMWGLRIPPRQDLHTFTSTTVLKHSSVTWAVTKPWCLCVKPSVHLQCTPWHACWPNRFYCWAGSGPSSGLSCPSANTACT